MRCDVIAEGIIAAARELNLTTPIVVRLQVSEYNRRRGRGGGSVLSKLTRESFQPFLISCWFAGMKELKTPFNCSLVNFESCLLFSFSCINPFICTDVRFAHINMQNIVKAAAASLF